MLGSCLVMKSPSVRYKGSLNRATTKPLQEESYCTRLYSHPPLHPGEQIILQQDEIMCVDSFDNYAEGIIHLTTYRIIFTGAYKVQECNETEGQEQKLKLEEDAEELSRNASRRQSITLKNERNKADSDVYKRLGRFKKTKPLRYSQSVRNFKTSGIPGIEEKNEAKLMTYRPILHTLERIDHHYELELSVPCASIYEIRKYSRKNLPKSKNVIRSDGFELLCSNIKSYRFCLQQKINSKTVIDSESLIKLLLYHTKPSFLRLFAFAHRKAITIPSKTPILDDKSPSNFYKFKEEFIRMGFCSATEWRVPSHSCEQYPRQTIVPSDISDEELCKVSNFHRGNTFPAVCWRQKTNGTVILRSSTTLNRRGLVETHCKLDEKFLKCVCQTNESATKNKLVIFTEQPKQSGAGLLNTPAQRMNDATGQLTPEQGETFYYGNCKFVYTDSQPDYKAVRQSAAKLQTFLATTVEDSKYLSSLEETEWLSQISELLQCATQAAVAVNCDQSSVMFSYEEGFDRTAQLSGLTQLLLDPYYRTVDGFQILIQKEWLSFVHKFADRNLPADTLDEHGPIFLQWLDCVWQVLQQFPFSFEFNSSLLELIAESAYSCRFGDFIANSDQMKGIEEKTTSLWTWLNVASMSDPDRFVNPRYRVNQSALFPRYHIPCLKVWTSFYSSAYKQDNVRDANKAGYIQSLKLEDDYKDLLKKHNQLSRRLTNGRKPSIPTIATTDVTFDITNDSDRSSSCEDEDDSGIDNTTSPVSLEVSTEEVTYSSKPQRRMTRSRSLDDMLSLSNQKTIKRRSIKRKVGGSKFYTTDLLKELEKEPRKRFEVPEPIIENVTSLKEYLDNIGIHFKAELTIHVTDTQCSGYMVKLGKVHKSWRKRWFVLDLTKRCLAYFENEKSQHPKGAISYQSIVQVYPRSNTEKKKRCLFYVETPSRTFEIQPPNEQCMKIWIACLTIPQSAIGV